MEMASDARTRLKEKREELEHEVSHGGTDELHDLQAAARGRMLMQVLEILHVLSNQVKRCFVFH
jgi:hypothetical protein